MVPSTGSRETTSGEGVRTLTASDIAGLVGGTLTGDSSAEVRALAPLDRATESDLSFLANSRYAPLYTRTRASTVLIAPEFAELATTAAARIVVAKPHDAMLTVLPKLYRAPRREPGVHATARLGRGVSLGDDVTIGHGAVVSAGSVVARSVPPQTLVQGNPAKPIAHCSVSLRGGVAYEQFLRHLKPLNGHRPA